MKNYLKIFAPVGLLILFGSLTFIFAQNKTETNGKFPKGDRAEFGKMPPPFGFAPNGLNPHDLEQINLTSEQKKQIRTLKENARAASEIYIEKMIVVEEQIKDTTEGEYFDETTARLLLKTKGEIQMEIEIIRLKTDTAIYNVLTARQIARLDLLKQNRPEMRPPQK